MSIFAALGAFVAANGGPIAAAVVVSQVIARAIPDDKKGVLGWIRTGAKIVGMYFNADEKKLATQQAAEAERLDYIEKAVRAKPVGRAPKSTEG